MLNNSRLWIQDIDRVLNTLDFLDELGGKTILITGANGLICSAIVDLLIRYNETNKESIKIIAAGRSKERVEKRFGSFSQKSYFEFISYDALDPSFDYNQRADFIIHGASNASPGRIINEPVETMTANYTGLLALLNYAKTASAERLLYISSSEVYGKKEKSEPFGEDEYGFIDLLNPRSSYPLSKRAAECLCVSYSEEYDVDSVIVRPGHIYGPTASDSDNRVSSSWAFEAASGKDLVMKSDGAQIRSYVYCLDCASAILTVLLKGERSCAYNISNPTSIITIRQMAELLSQAGGVSLVLEVPTDDEKKAFNPMLNSSLNSDSLMRLGWHGCFDAKEGFSHTVQILRGIIGT